ncbi:MAG: hypothetical protein JRI25_01520 [Deltaproteobacteria bacterium]|nr:hypothetical protein [Deltaproteobacteria bacterium]MBW2253259.1 hypothetical protein [Deltaproteobacteria bacterium]
MARILPSILLVTACASGEEMLPGDLAAVPPVAACLMPIPPWPTEAAAYAALNQDTLRLSGPIGASGTGDPPHDCWNDGGWVLWSSEQADPVETYWAVVEDPIAGDHVVAVSHPSLAAFPVSEGVVEVAYRVFFPAGRDEIPRGYLEVSDASGTVSWMGRHTEPEYSDTPDHVALETGDLLATYDSGCGGWESRGLRATVGGSTATLEHGETAVLDGHVVIHGGYAALSNSQLSAWTCPDVLGEFGVSASVLRLTGGSR